MVSLPVMSRTPSRLAEPGSWIGVAAQLHCCTECRKCSARRTCTGWSRRSASPGALVPARRSSQLLPATKPIVSARRSVAGVPHTQSSWPSASETAITASQSRAACPRTSSSSGNTRASGCAARWPASASSVRVIGASTSSADTPAAAERCQESATSARIRTPGASGDMSSVDRVIAGGHQRSKVRATRVGRATLRPRCTRVRRPPARFQARATPPVPSSAVACPSGLRSTPRKRVWVQAHRGFKSHRHRRHEARPALSLSAGRSRAALGPAGVRRPVRGTGRRRPS